MRHETSERTQPSGIKKEKGPLKKEKRQVQRDILHQLETLTTQGPGVVNFYKMI